MLRAGQIVKSIFSYFRPNSTKGETIYIRGEFESSHAAISFKNFLRAKLFYLLVTSWFLTKSWILVQQIKAPALPQCHRHYEWQMIVVIILKLNLPNFLRILISLASPCPPGLVMAMLWHQSSGTGPCTKPQFPGTMNGLTTNQSSGFATMSRTLWMANDCCTPLPIATSQREYALLSHNLYFEFSSKGGGLTLLFFLATVCPQCINSVFQGDKGQQRGSKTYIID